MTCMSMAHHHENAVQAALNRQDSGADGTADRSRWMPLQHMQDSVVSPATDVEEDISSSRQQHTQSQQSPPPSSLPCIPETSEPPATPQPKDVEEGRQRGGQRFYAQFVGSLGGGKHFQACDPTSLVFSAWMRPAFS